MHFFILLPLVGVSTPCSEDEYTMARIPSALETAHDQSPAAISFADHVCKPEEESDQGNQQVDSKHLSNPREHVRRRKGSDAGQSLQRVLANLDANEDALHHRNHSESRLSSYHALQHETEDQIEGEDTELQREQPKPILHIWSFTAYTWVHKLSYSTTLVAIALTALMCMQIFLVSMDCYESYNIRSEHSQCSCSFPYPWLVTAALRITSRFAIPLLLSIVFWCHVVCWKAGSAENQQVEGKFAAEIEKQHNHAVVREALKKFWLSPVKPFDNTSGKALLKAFRSKMNAELTCMCITSLLQSALLVIALFAFHLVDVHVHDDNWFNSSFWLEVVDALSFGITSAVSGVMLSFYVLESKIKHYLRAIHTTSSCSRTLRDKAKATEHYLRAIHTTSSCSRTLRDKAKATEYCITSRWYYLEIGMRYASVILPTILVISWASDVPLSCGFSVSVEAITQHSAAACWMGFIIVITLGQVMVTSPFKPVYIRSTGLTMEFVILSIFYWTFPTYNWMQLTHILYAIFPVSYLIWYHIASIYRQWIVINRVKEGNPTYVSRLASRIGLLILILATLAASIHTEYCHLHPSAIDKYNSTRQYH